LPFQHPSEQQSIAFVHACPSARQTFVHFVTLVMPNTGSHRPLQQSFIFGLQSSPGARHAILSAQTPFTQFFEQHSPVWLQPIIAVHAAPLA
jgi:hypothetical protein